MIILWNFNKLQLLNMTLKNREIQFQKLSTRLRIDKCPQSFHQRYHVTLEKPKICRYNEKEEVMVVVSKILDIGVYFKFIPK